MAFLFAVSCAAQQNLTLDQIISRHMQAIGGMEKIHALKSLVLRGMYHEGGAIPEGTPVAARNYSAFMRPYYQVIGDPADLPVREQIVRTDRYAAHDGPPSGAGIYFPVRRLAQTIVDKMQASLAGQSGVK